VRVENHWIAVSPSGPGSGSGSARLFAQRWVCAAAPCGARPIVLMHDSLGCVALWRDLPAKLSAATSRPVIAYDRLGFGQSSAVVERPALDFVAQEARTGFAAVCAAFGIERCVVLGHSVGGGMALECAAQQPERVEALITISAQSFVEDRTREGIRAAKKAFAEPQLFERLSRHHGDKARWVLDAWTETWLAPGFADWSLASVLPRVVCPVLAIHGEQDEYGSAAHPRRIQQECAGPVQVALLAELGHTPHREDPARVIGLAADFLAGLAPS